MQAFEIPLIPAAHIFSFPIEGATYRLSWTWNHISLCWVLDILNALSEPVVTGIPVVTGVDLLGQYKHLGFTQSLIVQTDNSPDAVPNYTNLGTTGRCYMLGLQ